MPYILTTDGRRKKLRNGDTARSAGELNYQLFHYIKHNSKSFLASEDYKVIRKYINQFLGKKPNYQKYNDMTGCLIRCHKEVYRRLGTTVPYLINIMNDYDNKIAKYEDIKIKQNGDVE